jgi:hypothetical protein
MLRRLLGLCALMLVAASLAGQPAAHAAPAKPVLAFYYPCYEPSDWNPARMADLPPEPYSGGSDGVIGRHIQQADDAGIDAFICTWYGPKEQRLNERCAKLLNATAGRDFNVTFIPDQAADFTGTLKTQQGMIDSLRYLRDNHMNHPNWLRWNGKPVIVFWNLPSFGGVDAWRQVQQAVDPKHEWFWLGEGVDFSYLDVFDGIYFFDITWAADPASAMNSYLRRFNEYNKAKGTNKPFVATVMPGYDDSRIRGGHVVRDRAGGDYYRRSWQAAIDKGAQAVVITSWNEWFEGHQIEPSRSYGNLYLDLTRDYAARFHGAAAPAPDPKPAPGGSRTFPETGQTVGGRLLEYWNGNGGLPVFGLPLTAEAEQQTNDGRFRMQLFERNRLELHPENARPYDVLLGRLGTDLLFKQGRPWETLPREQPKAGCLFFRETGHNLCEPFLSYWRSHGLELGDRGISQRESLALFGYPVTSVQSERNGDGWTGATQWFERARFEHHPENPNPYKVLLGRLGAELR